MAGSRVPRVGPELRGVVLPTHDAMAFYRVTQLLAQAIAQDLSPPYLFAVSLSCAAEELNQLAANVQGYLQGSRDVYLDGPDSVQKIVFKIQGILRVIRTQTCGGVR